DSLLASRQATLSLNAKEPEQQTQDCRPIQKTNPCTNPKSRPPCEIDASWIRGLTKSSGQPRLSVHFWTNL
ncbi:MAG TPA: hypothetical protein VF988_02765, partial [Verrucomicrobiae bacterium]